MADKKARQEKVYIRDYAHSFKKGVKNSLQYTKHEDATTSAENYTTIFNNQKLDVKETGSSIKGGPWSVEAVVVNDGKEEIISSKIPYTSRKINTIRDHVIKSTFLPDDAGSDDKPKSKPKPKPKSKRKASTTKGGAKKSTKKGSKPKKSAKKKKSTKKKKPAKKKKSPKKRSGSKTN
jgi:hypothetical protein